MATVKAKDLKPGDVIDRYGEQRVVEVRHVSYVEVQTNYTFWPLRADAEVTVVRPEGGE